MMYPERPNCHEINPVFTVAGNITWQVREQNGHSWRHCSYCGSLHPEDLLKIFELGGFLQGSDWKYGWPHKYYVEVPNPQAGQTVQIGSRNGPDGKGGRYDEPIMGTAGKYYTLKFYNEHLKDLLGQPEFELVAKAIHDKFDAQYYPRVAFIDASERGLRYVSGGTATYDEKKEWARKKDAEAQSEV